MKRRLQVVALAVTAVLSVAVSGADATLFIGLQQDNGPIVTVASAPTPAIPLVFAGAFGNFEGVSVSGFGEPGTVLPILLQTGTVEVNNAGPANAGTLTVYVTSTGNTAPVGSVQFTSGFATVNLAPTWTETLQSFIDPGNNIFALTTPLGSASFTTVDSHTALNTADAGAGPYSVTVVYRITAPSLASSSSTAGIAGNAVVPEPSSVALLGAGLSLIGFATSFRRKR
jgi:hypothetical protein